MLVQLRGDGCFQLVLARLSIRRAADVAEAAPDFILELGANARFHVVKVVLGDGGKRCFGVSSVGFLGFLLKLDNFNIKTYF